MPEPQNNQESTADSDPSPIIEKLNLDQSENNSKLSEALKNSPKKK